MVAYYIKKMPEYLRKHDIIQEDEDIILKPPLDFFTNINTLKSYTLLISIGGVLAIFGVFMLFKYENIYPISTLMLVVGIIAIFYGSIKNTNVRNNVHFFITSKGVYFNSDINTNPYTCIDISDLTKIEIITETRITYDRRFNITNEGIKLKSYTLYYYYLRFLTKHTTKIHVEVTEEFILEELLQKTFPKPELLEEIAFVNDMKGLS